MGAMGSPGAMGAMDSPGAMGAMGGVEKVEKLERQMMIMTQQMVGRCRLTVSIPVLKALKVWFQRLKLKYQKLLSTFAFNFNLRRCKTDALLDRLGVSIRAEASYK